MAKRKRLTLPTGSTDPAETAQTPAPETKSHFPMGVAQQRARPPIAQVTGDASAQSALDALADEVAQARRDGRFVQALPLGVIEARHLVRDRLVMDPEEMSALKASLAARGQQTPVEVVELGDGRYGLISGYRRLMALQALQEETGAERFGTVNALIRVAGEMSDSYVAMVEENEIRANLSFYERAHLACEAARLGVYPDARTAVQTLFSAASPARRSKILSFVRLHDAIGGALQHPAAIPERLGLALTAAIDKHDGFARRLRDALRKRADGTPAEERAMLERALKKAADSEAPETPAPAPVAPEAAPGIRLDVKGDRIVLRGSGVTEALVAELQAWLAAR